MTLFEIISLFVGSMVIILSGVMLVIFILITVYNIIDNIRTDNQLKKLYDKELYGESPKNSY